MERAGLRGFPLSSQQVSLWRQLAQVSGSLCAQTFISLEGRLNVEALKSAVETIVNRHEALRTTFRRWPGLKVPLQVVADVTDPLWREVDLTGCDKSAQDEHVRILMEQESSRDVDLEQGPMVSAVLMTLAPALHLLVITIPSLCADGHSLRNLFNDLRNSYADESSVEPFQYPDFSEWQRELLEAGDSEAEAGLGYWTRQVTSSSPLTLPFQTLHRGRSFQRPALISLELDEPLSARLEEVAARYETPARVLLLACLQTLLYRLTSEQSIVNGYIYNERSYDALSNACGLFTQCLPVRNDLAGAMPFSHVISKANEAVTNSEDWHEYFTGDEGRDLSEAVPLIAFEYFELSPADSAAEVTFKQQSQYCHFALFNLKLSVVRQQESTALEFHYNPESFTRNNIENIAGCLVELLKSVVQDPEAQVADLNLLTDANRQQLLHTFNETASDYPDQTCVHELFEGQVTRDPDAVAVVCEGRSLSYGELNARANQLAHLLRANGVGPETLVGLLMERSVDMIVGLLAILKAGGAYVPLNPDDPQTRLRQQLEGAGIRLVITQEALVSLFADFECKVICIDRDEEVLSREPDANLKNLALPQNLAYVIYTSGSTGKPKGVGITHHSLINYVRAIGGRLKPETFQTARPATYATVSTISADLGNTTIFQSLASGGCLHILSYETATNSDAFANYLHGNAIDVLKIVPSHLSALLSVEPNTDRANSPLPREWLILGGEPLPLSLIKQLNSLPATCRIMNHYGPTETTVGSLTCNVVERNDAPGPDAIMPIGRPLDNTRVYILDERVQSVPIGIEGELYISGEGLARGYLNAATLTAERFLPNPFAVSPGQRMYATGDRARYQADGSVEFLGRRDEQVKLHGYRIEMAEVAAAIRQAPGVRQAVVVIREDPEGERRLVAYVVLNRHKESPDVGALRDHLKQHLPVYMIPAVFVALERIPLTRNGKVDRNALPAPEEAHAKTGYEHVEPRTKVEKDLALLWEEVLRVDGIGVHDNFFELGGDSVTAIQVITGANRAGLYFSVKDMFEHQTIAELAEQVSMSSPAPVEVSSTALPKLDQQTMAKIAAKVNFEG